MFAAALAVAWPGLAGEVAEIIRYSKKRAVTNVVELAKLDGGGYRLMIAKEEIDPFITPRLDVCSPLVRARKGEAGYFVVGDGRYGTFRLDEAVFKTSSRFSPLPLSGMKTPRGTWMVVVRSLELESVSTMTIGNGVYSLVQSFDFKDWAAKKGLHPYEDLVVDFLPMPEGRDSYADIARRYREEQLAKGRVRPLAERAKESETLKYSAESIFVRVKHGWKALYTSWYPALGMASKAVDRLVPLWQLVYHGIILSNPFYATIDAYYERSGKNYSDSMQRFTYLDNAATRILKLHEFGGRPIFYYTRYEDIAPVKQAYEDYKKLSHLQYFYMDDHRELAPGVFLTRYSNGEELVTNYSPEPFAYRGRSVKPMSNELLK